MQLLVQHDFIVHVSRYKSSCIVQLVVLILEVLLRHHHARRRPNHHWAPVAEISSVKPPVSKLQNMIQVSGHLLYKIIFQMSISPSFPCFLLSLQAWLVISLRPHLSQQTCSHIFLSCEILQVSKMVVQTSNTWESSPEGWGHQIVSTLFACLRWCFPGSCR